MSKRTEEGLTRAAAEFEAATRRHPPYAPAYASIADSYLLLAYYAYLPPEKAFGRARAAALKALELDAGLAEAHVSLAGIYEITTIDGPTRRLNIVKRCASMPTIRRRISGTRSRSWR